MIRSLILASTAALSPLGAQQVLDSSAVSETPLQLNWSTQTQVTPAGTSYFSPGSNQGRGFGLGSGSLFCPSGTNYSVAPLRPRQPDPWFDEQGLVVRMSATSSFGISCFPNTGSIDTHTFAWTITSTAARAGALWIQGTGTPNCSYEIDVDGDGSFDLSGAQLEQIVPTSVSPTSPLTVRVRTSLSSLGDGTLRLWFRPGVPGLEYASSGCSVPRGPGPFQTSAWSTAGHVVFHNQEAPATNLPPFLVLGTQPLSIPLPAQNCPLLTDTLVVLQWPTQTLPRGLAIPYLPSASGAVFNAQWLVAAADPSTGAVRWFTSDAIRLTLE